MYAVSKMTGYITVGMQFNGNDVISQNYVRGLAFIEIKHDTCDEKEQNEHFEKGINRKRDR